MNTGERVRFTTDELGQKIEKNKQGTLDALNGMKNALDEIKKFAESGIFPTNDPEDRIKYFLEFDQTTHLLRKQAELLWINRLDLKEQGVDTPQ